MKTYGPYKRKDGRYHVVHYDGKNRTTQSYPRFLMEKELGRLLLSSEEVDHIDNDYTNNDISNLQILSKKDNRIKEIKRPHRRQKYGEYNCPNCAKLFTKAVSQVKHNNINKGKFGPFCSRSCAGTYNANKQYGNI